MSEPAENKPEGVAVEEPEKVAEVEKPKEESEPASSETKEETAKEEAKDEIKYGDEEETKGKVENKANLVTGTENEDIIYIHKAKMYRFRDGKWKERGNGHVKLLRNRKSNKIRMLQRAEKTKKVAVNFYGKSLFVEFWHEY